MSKLASSPRFKGVKHISDNFEVSELSKKQSRLG